MQLLLGEIGPIGEIGCMIVSFHHKGLKAYFLEGKKKGIQSAHAKKLKQILTALDSATVVTDMDLPGWDFHQLKGARKGIWTVHVNGNWCVTFRFENGNAEVVDYEDYH